MVTGQPAAVPEADLKDIHAGALEGLTRDDMSSRTRPSSSAASCSWPSSAEFGGESYDDVQARVRRLERASREKHRAAGHTVLLVAHGGINFQLLNS